MHAKAQRIFLFNRLIISFGIILFYTADCNKTCVFIKTYQSSELQDIYHISANDMKTTKGTFMDIKSLEQNDLINDVQKMISTFINLFA